MKGHTAPWKAVHPDQRECRSCGAPMVFLNNPKTGRAVPVNVDAGLKPEDLQYDPTRHKAHFITCPDAAKYRKKR